MSVGIVGGCVGQQEMNLLQVQWTRDVHTCFWGIAHEVDALEEPLDKFLSELNGLSSKKPFSQEQIVEWAGQALYASCAEQNVPLERIFSLQEELTASPFSEKLFEYFAFCDQIDTAQASGDPITSLLNTLRLFQTRLQQNFCTKTIQTLSSLRERVRCLPSGQQQLAIERLDSTLYETFFTDWYKEQRFQEIEQLLLPLFTQTHVKDCVLTYLVQTKIDQRQIEEAKSLFALIDAEANRVVCHNWIQHSL